MSNASGNPDAEPPMLRKWAAALAERRTIEEFLEWLLAQPDYRHKDVFDIHASAALDEYHKIDRRQLDEERRALLDAFRTQSGGA